MTMRLPAHLAMLGDAERSLALTHRAVTSEHAADADVVLACARFARQCDERAEAVDAFAAERYPLKGETFNPLVAPDFGRAEGDSIGLLRDLAALHQFATRVQVTWEHVEQAGHGLHDRGLIALASRGFGDLDVQVKWMKHRMKNEAAQALIATG